MTDALIDLPEPERINSFQDELELFVKTIDAHRDFEVSEANNGFTFLAEYIDGSIEDIRFGYDFGPVYPEAFDIVKSLASPLLLAMAEHEASLGENGSSHLHMEVHRRTHWPDTGAGIGWHSGDPDRYLLSNFSTDILVGSLAVPDDYSPSPYLENSYYFKGLGARGVAGDVVLQLSERDGELPDGVEIMPLEAGEIIRINKSHVHRTPPNHTDKPIDRILFRADPKH